MSRDDVKAGVPPLNGAQLSIKIIILKQHWGWTPGSRLLSDGLVCFGLVVQSSQLAQPVFRPGTCKLYTSVLCSIVSFSVSIYSMYGGLVMQNNQPLQSVFKPVIIATMVRLLAAVKGTRSVGLGSSWLCLDLTHALAGAEPEGSCILCVCVCVAARGPPVLAIVFGDR